VRNLALVAAAMAGCATRPGPVVRIDFTQAGVPDDVRAFALAGADAWWQLDVERDDATTLPACAPAWFDDVASLPCSITVSLTFEPSSEMGGNAGLTAKRRSMIAIELRGDQLAAVVAHELGHSIWNTPQHLDQGKVGIMATAASSTTPTDADVAFAHEHSDGWASE